MKIKFILIYYTKSRYLGMKREHIKSFNNMVELVDFRDTHKIKDYEIYRQVV